MAAKRERINPGRGGARFVRRDSEGKFDESEQVGRSLKQDRARKATHTAKSGQGDKGDRKTSSRGSSRSSSRGSSGRGGSSKKGASTAQKRGGGRKSGGGRSGTARHAARR